MFVAVVAEIIVVDKKFQLRQCALTEFRFKLAFPYCNDTPSHIMELFFILVVSFLVSPDLILPKFNVAFGYS